MYKLFIPILSLYIHTSSIIEYKEYRNEEISDDEKEGKQVEAWSHVSGNPHQSGLRKMANHIVQSSKEVYPMPCGVVARIWSGKCDT